MSPENTGPEHDPQHDMPEPSELTLPAGAELRAASAADNGYVLVVDTPSGQQIWRVSPSGERLQVISVTQE